MHTPLTLTLPLFYLETSAFYVMSAAYIQVNFRLDVFMEANNQNPDQSAHEVLGFIMSLNKLFKRPCITI